MSNPFPVEVAQPPRREPVEDIRTKREAIAAAAARIDGFGERVSREIEAINPNLTAGAQAAEARALREDFAETVAEIVAEIKVLRDALTARASYYTRDAVKARALHGETVDPIESAHLGTYWLARLAVASVAELVEVARTAASEFDRALCLAVENEVARRDLQGEEAGVIRGLCASVPTPPQEAAAMEAIIDGYADAEQAIIRAQEWTDGGSRPAERLAAAFAAAHLAGRPEKLPAVPGAVDPSMVAFVTPEAVS